MAKLELVLLPESAALTDLASAIQPDRWREIEAHIRSRANGRCELCEGPADVVRPTGLFDFDDDAQVQRLASLIGLCDGCWLVTQLGRSSAKAQVPVAIAHLRKVNEWDEQESLVHLRQAVAVQQQRNQVSWELDLGPLASVAIEPQRTAASAPRPAAPPTRPEVIEAELDDEGDDDESAFTPPELEPGQIGIPVPGLDEWMASLFELESGQVGPATKAILGRALKAGLPQSEMPSFIKELASEARKIRETLRREVPRRSMEWMGAETEFPDPDQALAMLWERENLDEDGVATLSCRQSWSHLDPRFLEWAEERVLDAADSARAVWVKYNGQDLWVIEILPDEDESE